MNAQPNRILVTGATRGIGLAISTELLKRGFAVLGTGRSTPQGFGSLLEEFDHASFAQLDLAKQESLHAFAKDNLDGLYGIVNNAAIARDGVLATMHESEVNEVFQTNVIGTITLTKYALRPMLLQRRGRVVNIASIIGSTGFNGLSVYGASKAAMLGFSRSLAREVGRAGITVNSVSPGFIATEMSAGIGAEGRRQIERRSALRRLATADEVAKAVSYLVSDDAAGVTGTNITVDAGNTA